MLSKLAIRTVAKRAPRAIPLLQLVSVVQVALLARRHVQQLEPAERKRLAQLVRRGKRMTPEERTEFRALAAKLDARAFVGGAADRISPVPLPRRFSKSRY